MLNQVNPFDSSTGANRLGKPLNILVILCIAVIAAWMISLTGIMGAIGFIVLPFIAVYLYCLFTNPIIGLYTALVLGFILLGLARYLRGVQVGLGMDAMLVMTYIALIISRFKDKVDWSPINRDITWLAVIWFCYSLFEVVNPEARSLAAWFSGRGVSLYMLMLVPLTLLFIDSNKKLDTIFFIWGIFTILGTLKGIMQLNIGIDKFEKAWLDDGNAQTHILFGKLRAFSFMSDAGQFGGNQAYSAVVATIVSLVQKDWRKKLFFIVVAILGLYGMIISGTRGSISIPLTGFLAFFVLRKNLGVMIFGFVLLLVVFIFFKYTSIGQGNDQIRRMRTAFDPNDASLQVRLENQKKLRIYLASRPFGGGIGLGGVKAQRYLPNAFLSNVATDSWYVLIWVEQGIIGLLLHLFILFYILIKGSYAVMFKIRDPVVKMKMAALCSGMFGVMVASYGNAVLGQMPTSIVIYITVALILNWEKFDTPAGSVALET